MTDPQKTLASIPAQSFRPDETIGEFTGRFIDGTQGKPAELVAMAVWRMCNRAYLDGLGTAQRERREALGLGR